MWASTAPCFQESVLLGTPCSHQSLLLSPNEHKSSSYSLGDKCSVGLTPCAFVFWTSLRPSGQHCMSQNVTVLPQKHSAPWIIRPILSKHMSGFMNKIRGFVLVWSLALAINDLPFTNFRQTRAHPIAHSGQKCLWFVLLSNITFLGLALVSHKTCFFCCKHEYEHTAPHPPSPF